MASVAISWGTPLGLQILTHAACAEFYHLLLAEPRIGFGKGDVVEEAVVFEARRGGSDDCLAVLTWLHARIHQAAHIGLGAHLPAEGSYGIGVEAGFVEKGAGLGGFAPKWHEDYFSGISIRKCLLRRQR